jgi:hypothetical protein
MRGTDTSVSNRLPLPVAAMRGAVGGLRAALRMSEFAAHLLGGRLARIPTALLTDDYGFSLSDDGWHYFRALLADYEQRPDADPEQSVFYRFFRHPRVAAVRYLDDILFLHKSQRRRPTHRFYLGTYPWGDWTRRYAVVGGNPFGLHYDRVEHKNTRDLYGFRRNIWYQPGDNFALRAEWTQMTRLYDSMRSSYAPMQHGSLPAVIVLRRTDGAQRYVRYEGHHRLSGLCHMRRAWITVLIPRVSIGLVDERNAREWYYVKRGLCTLEDALEIFHAFFELNGRERIEFLGLPHTYANTEAATT